ncbi:MAG: hypothetical protein HW416_745 [Chloroflexi bacterium]|nr:hypothetical protein [Chloroflexota bacterium]
MREISDRVRSQCRLIAEQARVVTGAPRANFLLYDEATGRLFTVATTSAETPLEQVALNLIRRNYPDLNPLQLSYSPNVNRVVAAAFIGQRTQVSTMAEAFENIYPAPVSAVTHGLVGVTHVVTCPAIAERRSLGLIRFLVANRPDTAAQALMEAAASQVGLTLANATLAELTRRQLAATRAIGEVARLGASASVQETLDALVGRVRELTVADAALVYLVDPDGATFHAAAESLTFEAKAAQIGRIDGPQRLVGTGMVGWVIASGEAAFIPDLSRDPRSSSHHLTPAGEASIAVPMWTNGQVIGCLRVAITGGRRFTESDLWLVQTLANEASLALDSVRRQAEARADAHLAGQRSVASAVVEELGEPIALLRKAASDKGAEPLAVGAALTATERMEARLRKLAKGPYGHGQPA